MEDVLLPVLIVGMLFIGMPWVIMHYITKWKQAKTLTSEDEGLLDELHDMARRLDDRLCSIERIMTVDNPNWKSVDCAPPAPRLDERRDSNIASLRGDR